MSVEGVGPEDGDPGSWLGTDPSGAGDLAAAEVESLLRLFVLARDFQACMVLPTSTWSARQLTVFGQKRESLERALRDEAALLDRVAALAGTDWREIPLGSDLTGFLSEALRAAGSIGGEGLVSLLVDVASFTAWPGGLPWAPEGNADAYVEQAAAELAPDRNLDVSEMLRLHRAAAKRLRKDSMSPAMQAGVGVFMAAGLALSGGAANALGTMVGTHVLGLSGAAATSAGLAALGGGSLAAGGFGMAGGAVVGSAMLMSVKSVGQRMLLGVVIGQESPHLFIHELAKMDVNCETGLAEAYNLVDSLRLLEHQLQEQFAAVPGRAGRHERVADHARGAARGLRQLISEGRQGWAAAAREVSQAGKQAWEELPTKNERNLTTSIRAVEFEIRHLTSPAWKRQAAKLPRFVGLPAGSRLLDRID